MKVDNLKDLERVIKLCRRTGVEHIIVDGVEINLGPEPIAYKHEAPRVIHSQSPATPLAYNPTVAYTVSESTQIPTDGLTDEQLLFYSVAEQESEQA